MLHSPSKASGRARELEKKAKLVFFLTFPFLSILFFFFFFLLKRAEKVTRGIFFPVHLFTLSCIFLSS